MTSSSPSVSITAMPSSISTNQPSLLPVALASTVPSSSPSAAQVSAPSTMESTAPSSKGTLNNPENSSMTPSSSTNTSSMPSGGASAAPSPVGTSLNPGPPSMKPSNNFEASTGPTTLVSTTHVPTLTPSGIESTSPPTSNPTVSLSPVPSSNSTSIPTAVVNTTDIPTAMPSATQSTTQPTRNPTVLSPSPTFNSTSTSTSPTTSSPTSNATPLPPPPQPPPPPILSPSHPPKPGCIDVKVDIVTDQYPDETTWIIKGSEGGIVARGGPYTRANAVYTAIYCLQGDDLTFKVTDLYGDGLCCTHGNGSYSVSIWDRVVGEGDQFGRSESIVIMKHPSGSPPPPPPPPSMLAPVPIPTLNPTRSPSKQPTKRPTKQPTKAPTKAPTRSCSDVEVEIRTDGYPTETTWNIKGSQGSIVARGGPYSQRNTVHTERYCLEENYLAFKVVDRYGDGLCCSHGNGSYSVSIEGSRVAMGDQFGRSESTEFIKYPTGWVPIRPKPAPSPTQKPSTKAPTRRPTKSRYSDLSLRIVTDWYAAETTWSVHEYYSGRIVKKGGPYRNAHLDTIKYTESLSTDGCYVFSIFDTHGDGICCSHGEGFYILSFDTTTRRGGDFERSEFVFFGDGCGA